jgi:hypothetical protein
MSFQINRSHVREVFLLCLLSLYPASALGQLPVGDNVPILTQAVSPLVNTDPVAALRSAKLIYVRSSSVLVGASVVEAKLQKRAEFSRMGLVITREVDAADLILEVEHDIFTKYVYTAIDRRTSMVVASGKLSSLGGTVAGKVAKRFLKQVQRARATAPGTWEQIR